ENPFLVSKQLHSLLLVLLKLNANPNFIPIDTDLAKYLAEKVKPVLIEKLRANGLKFLVKRQQGILLKLAMDGIHASKSTLFTNEELKEIIGILDPRRNIL
uniref:Uncharacterized protein n=1 Tax=Romanomermis culicivorax TaxID=13658 RepID=A0A915JD09_ROMCU